MPITASKPGPQVIFCENYPGITLKQAIQFEVKKPFQLAVVAYPKQGPQHEFSFRGRACKILLLYCLTMFSLKLLFFEENILDTLHYDGYY